MSIIPDGITRDDVLAALGDLDAGYKHQFGESTGYDLLYLNGRYPPKAVLGLAARRSLGGLALGPYDFKGGEKSQCFRVLRDLGFTIIPKSDPVGPGTHWTEDECRSVVEAYFSMLEKEVAGEPFNKAERRRALQSIMPSRTEKSVEFKLQNVSAALQDLGIPFIGGYKPLEHYQALLMEVVLEHVGSARLQLERIERAASTVPTHAPGIDVATCEVAAPLAGKPASSAALRTPRPVLSDFAAMDARNRGLGLAGEEFILEVEKARLQHAGFASLAAQVRHVSKLDGDGLGYDIASYSVEDQRQVYIEVKTTNCPASTPFYVSANEVEASADLGDRYRLHRVYNFKAKPQFYVLRGPLEHTVSLVPKNYLARCR